MSLTPSDLKNKTKKELQGTWIYKELGLKCVILVANDQVINMGGEKEIFPIIKQFIRPEIAQDLGLTTRGLRHDLEQRIK